MNDIGEDPPIGPRRRREDGPRDPLTAWVSLLGRRVVEECRRRVQRRLGRVDEDELGRELARTALQRFGSSAPPAESAPESSEDAIVRHLAGQRHATERLVDLLETALRRVSDLDRLTELLHQLEEDDLEDRLRLAREQRRRRRGGE